MYAIIDGFNLEMIKRVIKVKGKKIYYLFSSNILIQMNRDEIKQITVRINGTFPDITTLSSEQISERELQR